jgi:hypothetical protein
MTARARVNRASLVSVMRVRPSRSQPATSIAQYVRIASAPARRMPRMLSDRTLTVDDTGGGGVLDHRVLPDTW